jgi:acyl dehydratase
LPKQEYTPDQIAARIGEVAGQSDWLEMTQDRITAFGGVTLDFDPYHIDPGSAASGPFGVGTAQGLLTLSLLPHLVAASDFAISHHVHLNYGFNRVRFIEPVQVGRAIRAQFRFASAEQRPDGSWLIGLDVEVEQQAARRPCMAAEWLILVDHE